MLWVKKGVNGGEQMVDLMQHLIIQAQLSTLDDPHV
jgi:hypothetical protein